MTLLERWLPFRFKRNAGESRGKVPVRVQRRPEPAPNTIAPSVPPLQQLMQSFFNDSFLREASWPVREPFSRLAEVERWFGDFSPIRFSPSIDVTDEESSLRITAELPGMSKDDIELSIEDDVLTIRGEKRNSEEGREHGVYRIERYYGYFERSLPLPGDVDRERVEAAFDQGVLTVRLPKTKRELTGRKIAIKG